jgi:hypothetical protein
MKCLPLEHWLLYLAQFYVNRSNFEEDLPLCRLISVLKPSLKKKEMFMKYILLSMALTI